MGRGQNKECSASGYIFVRRVILVHFMFPGSCVGPRQTHSSFMEDPGESAPCSETGLGETNTISNLSAVSRGCEKKKEKHFLQSIRPLFSLCSNLIIAAPISHDLWPRRLLGTDRSGLRRGAREAAGRMCRGHGGLEEEAARGDKPTYEEVPCDAEKKQPRQQRKSTFCVTDNLTG